jgi:hypothetical protein
MSSRLLPGLLVLTLLAFGLATGCTRKKQNAAPPPAPKASTAVTPEEKLAELHAALELWTFQRNQPPKDLNELVTTGYLKQLPTPPAGKKFLFDPAKMRVSLVAE